MSNTGIFSYYDPKNLNIAKEEIDITDENVIVRLTGKNKNELEFKKGNNLYLFKVKYNITNI